MFIDDKIIYLWDNFNFIQVLETLEIFHEVFNFSTYKIFVYVDEIHFLTFLWIRLLSIVVIFSV